MASTYSTNLAIELMGTGDQAGTWGTTTNNNLGTLIEQAISGYVTQAITDGADTVITIPNGSTGVARNMYIEMTGALTAARNLIVPTNKKLYFIYNNTTGGFAVTVKVSGQTGVSVPNGAKVLLVSNGTDVVTAFNYTPSLTLGAALPVASGGTGLTSTPSNGQLDIGNGTGFTRSTLTAGSGVTITNGSGTITISATGSGGTVTGSGTTNYLSKFTSSTAIGNSVVYDDGTNIGIGTNSPADKLTVQKDTTNGVSTATFINGATPSATGQSFRLRLGSFSGFVSNPQLAPYVESVLTNVSNGYSALAFGYYGSAGTAEGMRLDSSGNVGIGTSSPATKLEVSGSAAVARVTGTSASVPQLSLSSAGVVTWSLRANNGGASDFTIFQDSTERARIDSSGNLLVGTTTSGNKLYVAGGASTPSVAVTFSATAMTVNCQLANVFSTTFTANVTTAPTLSSPSDGQTINWFITQDGTGSRTMTWPTSFKWAGGTAGTLSTAANSVDLLVATYRSATGFWYASLSKAFS
jgi:hypothetical protein